MPEMTLQGLLRMGRSHFAEQHAKWMLIKVEVNGNTPEIIINPKENFAAKLDYYSKAYNEDLTLKTNSSIKIIYFNFCETIEDCANCINR